MPDCIGILNSGSSSIKYSIFAIEGEELSPTIHGQIEALHTSPHFIAKDSSGTTVAEKSWERGSTLDHRQATGFLLEFLRDKLGNMRLIGIGHRVVHGGLKYTHPVLIDSQIVADLERLIPLAPLHQPYSVQPMQLGLERRPDLPQVACFDTQFHATCPEVAQAFALPASLRNAGLRRYGFHGPSYDYISSVLPQYDRRASEGRTVVLHLGSGASMCALQSGKSVATTTGFSSLDGLPMGTRCGAIDPGVILFLMQVKAMGPQQIEQLLYKESGLLGLSGISSDMRVLLESAAPSARLAVDYFVYRIGRELGSLAAALHGLDAIVFTAGIGEKSYIIRERVCRDAAWLGVNLDEVANAAHGPRISTERSPVTVWVIPTNEELMIAYETYEVLKARKGGTYDAHLDTTASLKG